MSPRERRRRSGPGRGPEKRGRRVGKDVAGRESTDERKSAEFAGFASSRSNFASASRSPLQARFIHPRRASLMRIHQTPWTGRLDENVGLFFSGRVRFERIVRNRLSVNRTRARTTGMPMYDPIS